jgi:hypothetical protein
MSENMKSEAISRRRLLSLLGLATAMAVAGLPSRPTAAQTVGMERRQERRAWRRERRQERREGRYERREERREGRQERRETRGQGN